MTDVQAIKAKNEVRIQKLPGFIHIDEKESGSYGTYCMNTFVKDGKVFHEREYLGKLLDPEQGLFHSRKRGYFTFDLQNGFGEPDHIFTPEAYRFPKIQILNFGDVWMVDQILKHAGLTDVLDNLIPGAADTVKSLVAFRLLEANGYDRAEDWYRSSYARLLYPKAIVTSSMISKYHALLGQEETYNNFFQSYLSIISKREEFTDQITLPILIDSTGLPNDIKNYLTAINNHNGVISQEIRLIYIVDQDSKLPIFFRYIPGNIIDNSTLVATINLLTAYNIKIYILIMDAGYSSLENIKKLISSGIPFITRMTKNRKEYKELLSKYGKELECPENVVSYGGRSLYGKKVPISLCGQTLFAYVMLDSQQKVDEERLLFQKHWDDPNRSEILSKKLPTIGRFVILSSQEYDIQEILPLYYTRQIIEQTFDVSKNFADLLPLRAHSEETIRGRLLLSFISTIIYIIGNQKLNDTKLNMSKAIMYMHNLKIKMNKSVIIIEELTKIQKEIFSKLKLESPFYVEKGNLLEQTPLQENGKPRGRGRPKGSKSKKKAKMQTKRCSVDSGTENKRSRGRPKGSTNIKTRQLETMAITDSEAQRTSRGRGRPKGSKNKIKTPTKKTARSDAPHLKNHKGRGRPKGSRNKIKIPTNKTPSSGALHLKK